ncbi:MAG: hypothetical protein CM1200mP41_07020 [Gammaproteobacteria bacterium]|nr:MAG: hypothetical protein CM1200mP41_07020 [Gammaproteobacteria bacterium]
MEMVEEALAANAEIIMFDNLDLDEVRQGMKIVNGRAITEASGGIKNTPSYPLRKPGGHHFGRRSDHSVTANDVSLDVLDIKPTATRTINRLRQST